MAINKNFVIKNGAEINTKLLVADADTQKVGIGTTRPSYTLHVMGPGDNTGGIGATYIYTTGITTTQALNVLGVSTFNAGPILLARGEQTGTSSQSLQVGTATTVSGAYISGNLGLANTNPTSTLHVVGNALITGVTTISGGISLPQGADLARLRVTGITTLGQTNTTGLSNAGVSTLGNATASTLVVSGFTTESGGTSAALLVVSGVSTFNGGLDANQGIDATGLLVTGVSTFSGGLNASQGGDLARLRVTGITTLGQTNTTGLSNAGVSTLGDATASTAVVTGFSTLGGASATLLNVSGITTVAGGFNATQGGDLARLRVTGITTLGDATSASIVISGVSTLSGGLNASQGADLARLRVTGITTLGQTNTTGLSNAGVSTLGNATASTLVVSGFTTESGGTSATLLTVSGVATVSGGLLASQGVDSARLRVTGITTLGDATATNLSLAGITTGLNASGISTLTSLTGTNVNYSGIGTIANLRATNANVSGVTTTDSLNVNSSFNVFAPNAIFSSDVTINGNLSIGGTSTIINAASLIVEDKDIILGFTTSQLPTDTTANHGGIAVASTEGTPLVTFAVTGINTLPATYKQIMWVKSNTMGAGTTDAWLFNYSVGIGSTLVPNNVRLAVGAVQVTEDAINARVGNLTHVRSTNINATGITTTNSLSIDATQVISSARQLQNIASLDAVTTATIEAAISNAPNTFTDLNVTGITTLSGGVNASQGADLARLRVTGITTLGQANITGLSNAGVSTLGNATASTLVVSGFSTLSSISAGNLTLAGITTGLNAPGISTFGDTVVSDLFIAGITTGLNASGISTLTSVAGASANFSGISTLAFVQNTTLNVSGFSTLGAASATLLNVSGVSTFTNGPVLIGSGTSTGTASQPLQVTGGAYVSGNLGVGRTNPSVSLHITGGSAIGAIVERNTTGESYIRYQNSSGTMHAGISTGATFWGIGDSTNFTTAPYFVVTNTTGSVGNVGIGTTNPSTNLHINGSQRITGTLALGNRSSAQSGFFIDGSTGGDYGLIFRDSSDADRGIFLTSGTAATGVSLVGTNTANRHLGLAPGDTEKVRITSTGNVGIGSTIPTSKLDVAGDVKVIGIVTATGGFNLGIQTNGVNVTTGVVTALNFVGTGNTITYNAGTKTVSINIAGSAGGGGGGVTEIKTSGISTTNPIGVGSFATASFRSASVLAQINQNAQYQVGRYLMIHDGTTVTLVEDAAVSTGSSMLGTFTGVIVGSNAELRVSLALPQSTAGVATVTTKIDTITL